MNKKIGSLALAVLFGIAGVMFAVLMLLTLFVPNGSADVRVKEPIAVSSSLVEKEGGLYMAQISGSLLNEGDAPLTVDAIKITIGDGKTERELVLDGFVLESRLVREILYDVPTQTAFDRVLTVTIVCNGEASVLSNQDATISLDLDTLVWFGLTLLAIHFAIRFGKRSYYIKQEETMTVKEEHPQ